MSPDERPRRPATSSNVRRLASAFAGRAASHRERHAPGVFEIAGADRVDALSARLWDAATEGGSSFLQRPFLRALENAPPANVRPVRALVCRKGEPIAAVAAQFARVDFTALAKAGSKRARLARIVPLEEHVLVCGNLLSWGPHGVAFAPGVDATEAWPGVAEALYRLRRADRNSGETSLVVVKDLPRDHEAATAGLTRVSYRRVETEPDMVLELRPAWRRYDDYLASLSSSYRKSARKLRKEFEDAGGSIARIDDVAAVAQRLHELYLQVHERQKMRLFTLAPDFLATLAREMPDELRVLGAFRGQELVGFTCCWRDRETAVGWFIGYDSDAAAEMPIYLRMLHALVGEAIEIGARRLSLGRTALEPKARLGARPEPLAVYVRHRVPAMNLALRALRSAITHDEPPDRSPFKDSDSA